jgi:Tol biopolymer transport system component
VLRVRVLGLVGLLAIPFAAGAGAAATPSRIVFSADRAPQLSGVVYRLDPNGHRVALNGANPYGDSDPLVSPDGKEVAFFSYRGVAAGQAPRIFEASIDGTHVTDLTPSLAANAHAGSIAWQPRGDRLAAITDDPKIGGPDALWILRRGHQPLQVATVGIPEPIWSPPSWSPDGRVLLEWSAGAWRAFSPNGKGLWKRGSRNWGGCCGVSWSSQGLVAITTRHQLRVYDEGGHRRFEAQAPAGRIGPPAWSPSGREVGFVAGGVVEVRMSQGRLLLRKRLPTLKANRPNDVVLASDRRLVAGIPVTGPQEGVNVATGKLWTASGLWLGPRSANGKLAVVTPAVGANFAVGVKPVGGGPSTSYGQLPTCEDAGPPAQSLQFVGRSRSVVYLSACNALPFNLYTMAPDGTGLHEVTALEPDATEPALSPDGTQVAYVWTSSTSPSSGSQIRVANADGTGVRVLASFLTPCYTFISPTWSPDGQTILFAKATSDAAGCMSELYTVPAAGGPVRDLGVAGSAPAWGPDRIAYQSDADEALTTAEPDGSDPVEAASPGVAHGWTWSPDGRLAYLTDPFGTRVVVGNNGVALPFSEVASLAWSPDGTRFVVTAQQSQQSGRDVYTLSTSGGDPVRLTTGYDASGVDWH